MCLGQKTYHFIFLSGRVSLMDTYQPSAFRLAERKYKYYKSSKNCCKDFLDVVDFSNIEANSPINKERIVSIKSEEQPDIPIYSLSDKNGFYFIPNGLKINDQAQLIKNSIYEYSSTPNYANFGKLDCNLWEKYKEEMFNKVNLTWVTLGYHYNWTTNIYENTPERITEFPNYLVDLSIKFATQCNFQSYQPEAGIINYYKVNSSMMKAHQDESEFTFHQPIVSMSIGNSCIFLLGGINTVEPPTAIWMRSGDVMVMGGHSRVFFHGNLSAL